MKFPLEKVLLAAIALLALAVGVAIAYILIPVLAPGLASFDSLRTVLGVAIMLSIMLAGFLAAIVPILGIVEVLTSKNGNEYKALWTIALLAALVVPLIGYAGLAAYVLVGRKDLKE